MAEFIFRVSMLKPDSPQDVIAVNSCSPFEGICQNWENSPQDFFYIYTCLFTDLHITLPFDEFKIGVIRILNIAMTQFHPNCWAALQASRLICDCTG